MDDWHAPQVEVAALPARFAADVVLLDVREHDEWRRGHAEEAQHIPMGEVPGRIGEIDIDKEIFVICHSGGRSQRVATYLRRSGYEASNVDGGMLAWVCAGRPVIGADGAPGTV